MRRGNGEMALMEITMKASERDLCGTAISSYRFLKLDQTKPNIRSAT